MTGRITKKEKESFMYSIKDISNSNTFFHIEELEKGILKHPEALSAAHNHDFYTILYFTEGDGVNIVDFKEYKIKPHTIFFMPPRQLHQLAQLNNCKGIFLSFTEDFLNHMSKKTKYLIKQTLFSMKNGASICQTNHECFNILNEDCKRLLNHIEKPANKAFQNDYLASLLSQFLFDVIECGDWEEIQNNEIGRIEYNVYAEFMEFVEQEFRRYHTTANYVDLISVSLSTLNKYVLSVSGKTPARLISERIAIEAKRMLYERTDMRIKEIARDLGFIDNSNFVKFFKRYVGVSPIEFRENL